MKATIYAISNQKGGVGKTTTAVNLAACLAAAEKKVLLVDFDPQGNASSGFGVILSPEKPSMYHVICQGIALKEMIVKTELSTLDLAPANQELIGAEIELVSEIGRESRLKEALEPELSSYDYIIIDCPPALGLLTVNALTAADRVIIPLQCEYYALEGLSQLMKTISLIKRKLNPELEVEGILLTMYDRRNNLSHQVELDVRQHFGAKVFPVMIPRNVRLSEAPSHGKPVILYDVTSSGALAYMDVARLVIENRTSGARITGKKSKEFKNQDATFNA